MSENLGDLVARIQQGDRSALDEFVRRHGQQIRQAAKRRIWQLHLEDEIEPDEILNGTALELWQNAGRIEALEWSELWHYVDCVIRSKANEAWRRKNSRKRGGGVSHQANCYEQEPADGRARMAEQIDLEDEINHTYDELTGDERVISMLRRSGWSWEEIAVRLCSSADAVRKRWERAVARVLRLLD